MYDQQDFARVLFEIICNENPDIDHSVLLSRPLHKNCMRFICELVWDKIDEKSRIESIRRHMYSNNTDVVEIFINMMQLNEDQLGEIIEFFLFSLKNEKDFYYFLERIKSDIDDKKFLGLLKKPMAMARTRSYKALLRKLKLDHEDLLELVNLTRMYGLYQLNGYIKYLMTCGQISKTSTKIYIFVQRSHLVSQVRNLEPCNIKKAFIN